MQILTQVNPFERILLGILALAVFIAEDRKRVLKLAGAALVPVLCHFVFRWFYYGSLLPNTYYLKVEGLPDKYSHGLRYARNFVLTYRIPVALAIGGSVALWLRDKRGAALCISHGDTCGAGSVALSPA